ncbi:MAG TPA: hypothetical protein VD886_08165, partial [Herpetosiphonaceae bacterium]|nr:hypothetical protein [Herpetosiphonaceae bacterium]
IAAGTDDGEAWGVFNNVNDRVKWDQSHYPPCQAGQTADCSTNLPALPTQASGGGFSYTIEHEAAHNLGLAHPHDGAYGVDRCPADDAVVERRGKWECYWTGLGWMFDSSAAPTTYAMSYRPYEVEDQDALQRGHAAEYLVAAQEALRARLVQEAAAGATAPSAAYRNDYARMVQWRAQAGTLFRRGDWLHAEYAARNAALAARGVPQTSANTIDPRLVEAGQVFYFNIHPQPTYAVAPVALKVRLTGPAQAAPGGKFSYVIRVTATGVRPMRGVVLEDTLDPNLSFVSASNGGTLNGNTVVWNLGSLGDGESFEVTLTVQARKTTLLSTQISNAAAASSQQVQPSASNTVQTVVKR